MRGMLINEENIFILLHDPITVKHLANDAIGIAGKTRLFLLLRKHRARLRIGIPLTNGICSFNESRLFYFVMSFRLRKSHRRLPYRRYSRSRLSKYMRPGWLSSAENILRNSCRRIGCIFLRSHCIMRHISHNARYINWFLLCSKSLLIGQTAEFGWIGCCFRCTLCRHGNRVFQSMARRNGYCA